MLNRRNTPFILMLFLMLLSACAPKTPSLGPRQPSGEMVTKEKAGFVIAAKAVLSQKLGMPEEKITFVSADGVEWSDSCLGLGGPAESCLQAITPGYKVILAADGKQYEIHTDESGSMVRIKE